MAEAIDCLHGKGPRDLREHCLAVLEAMRGGTPNTLSDRPSSDTNLLRYLQPARIRELAEHILELLPQGEILHNGREKAGVSRMCADLTVARAKLNFRPRYSLAEGLHLTVERDPRFQPTLVRA